MADLLLNSIEGKEGAYYAYIGKIKGIKFIKLSNNILAIELKQKSYSLSLSLIRFINNISFPLNQVPACFCFTDFRLCTCILKRKIALFITKCVTSCTHQDEIAFNTWIDISLYLFISD